MRFVWRSVKREVALQHKYGSIYKPQKGARENALAPRIRRRAPAVYDVAGDDDLELVVGGRGPAHRDVRREQLRWIFKLTTKS